MWATRCTAHSLRVFIFTADCADCSSFRSCVECAEVPPEGAAESEGAAAEAAGEGDSLLTDSDVALSHGRGSAHGQGLNGDKPQRLYEEDAADRQSDPHPYGTSCRVPHTVSQQVLLISSST